MRRPPWYPGVFATAGPGCPGVVQWAVTAGAGPGLRAIAPQITTSGPAAAIYQGGAFSRETMPGWAVVIGAEGHLVRVAGDAARRVAAARDRARRRLDGTPWRLNRGIPAAGRRRSPAPPSGAVAVLRRACSRSPAPGQLTGPAWPARPPCGGAAPRTRGVCGRAAAVAGSRAATACGQHVASQITAGLSEAGWMTVAGGAYGIDAAAHRAALACG